MVETGACERFSSYKLIRWIYNDYNILFIKDVTPLLWYLIIMDAVDKLIAIHHMVDTLPIY